MPCAFAVVEDLGIKDQFSALSDITGGSIDDALVGRWVSADGRTSYTYAADGTQKIESEDYGNFDVKYTCITCGDYKILCEEVPMTSSDAEGNATESTALSYTAYEIENDVLYMAMVEEHDPMYTTNQTALVSMFKADGSGSAARSMAKNPIDLSCLNGTWVTEKGSFTIENGVLTCDGESGKLSFNDKNQLVVEKDGSATVYSMNLSILKNYDDGSEKTMLGLYYTGADEDDLPNLLHLMDDWKTDYAWDTWYYTGSFELQ